MKKLSPALCLLLVAGLLPALTACKNKKKAAADKTVSAMALKRGKIILCGPPDKQLGTVAFTISCPDKVKGDFNLAVSLLHSFEYDEAEKVFAKVIDEEPGCAIAYWGVAMCNYHPLWAPPTEPELEKGAKAVSIARSIEYKTTEESAYIEAAGAFYDNWRRSDHRSRAVKFEKAMERIYFEHPDDHEAAIFYALAMNGTADPTDISFSKQKEAGRILTDLYPDEPLHPGVIHYIIHSYDYPELAKLALPAARKYAAVAPSSAHAQHMPSHIFTRLGLWDECIQSNLAATGAAKCYAENAGLKGHWDEELHGMDYLVYAYLQKGDNTFAKQQCDYLRTIHEVSPLNFKVAYAFAAIPARYVLENKLWKEAAALEPQRSSLRWDQYPWEKGILHFTRLMGNVHTGNLEAAKKELKALVAINDTLTAQKDPYKANQVLVQIRASQAWMALEEGRRKEAVQLMKQAAELEDKLQKHPVTPCEVMPARELLGDMYLEINQPENALAAYEAGLEERPNRFNGLYGAGVAAERCGRFEMANAYYQQLAKIAGSVNSNRPELKAAISFLNKQRYQLAKRR